MLTVHPSVVTETSCFYVVKADPELSCPPSMYINVLSMQVLFNVIVLSGSYRRMEKVLPIRPTTYSPIPIFLARE